MHLSITTTVLALAALTVAQDTYTCPSASGNFCATSANGAVLLECTNNVARAIPCRSRVNSATAYCFQTSTTAGDAACARDGKAFADGQDPTNAPEASNGSQVSVNGTAPAPDSVPSGVPSTTTSSASSSGTATTSASASGSRTSSASSQSSGAAVENAAQFGFVSLAGLLAAGAAVL